MSTVKSDNSDLTINADGSGRSVKFQANGVEKASIDSSGNFTSTSIDATKLSGTVPNFTSTGIDDNATSTAITVNSSGTVNMGSIVPTNKSVIDTSSNTIAIASGGTYDFPTSSGFYLVNNHSAGSVAIFLCGAGATAAVSSLGTSFGSMSYVPSIAGYRWTANYSSTATYTFTHIRTRHTA